MFVPLKYVRSGAAVGIVLVLVEDSLNGESEQTNGKEQTSLRSVRALIVAVFD